MAMSKKSPGVTANPAKAIKANATPKRASVDARIESMVAAGWRVTGGGKVVGWEVDREIIGTLVALRDGKFGPLADVRLLHPLPLNGEVHEIGEVIALGCPTVLHNRLRSVPIGDSIYVRCTGTIETEKGQSAWDFTVLSRKPADPDQEELPF
jgi:hypothetical protein